jgi:hypothetical protein
METLQEWHTPTVIELVIPEEWRPVVGYEGYYEVSNTGKVKSLARTCRSRGNGTRSVLERVLKPSITSHGRLVVRLQRLHKDDDAIMPYVHSLELTAFIGPRPPGMECRHLNGDPQDNRLINLTWGTRQENANDKMRHGTQAKGDSHYARTQPWRVARGDCQGCVKLTKWNILIDIPILSARGWPQRWIAKEFSVHYSTIHAVFTGKTWAWLYEEAPPEFTPETDQIYLGIRGMMVIDGLN